MTTFTQSQGARTSVLDLGTLASSNYITSPAINFGSSIPLDETVELLCTPSSSPVAGGQLVLFAKLSLDGTNYGSGPESGSTNTNELDLHWIGTLPCADNTLHRKMFSLSGLPVTQYLKLVVKNELGVALASGTVYRADITGAA